MFILRTSLRSSYKNPLSIKVVNASNKYFPWSNYVSRRTYHVSNQALARVTPRRTTTQTQETTTSQTELQDASYQRPVAGSPYQAQEPEPTYEAQGEYMTPGVQAHLTKVYGLMMAGCGMATVGAVVGMLAPVLALPAAIGGFVAALATFFTNVQRVTLRQNLFLLTGALMGMGIAPLLASTSAGVIFAAALGTSAIFGGFTLAALKAKRKSMLMLGGPLLGGLLLIFGAGLATLLLPFLGVTNPAILGALYNVNLYGGLLIFSLFIAYDTQRMIEDYHDGARDHITPALNMFLNLLNIFTRLIRIFRGDN